MNLKCSYVHFVFILKWSITKLIANLNKATKNNKNTGFVILYNMRSGQKEKKELNILMYMNREKYNR